MAYRNQAQCRCMWIWWNQALFQPDNGTWTLSVPSYPHSLCMPGTTPSKWIPDYVLCQHLRYGILVRFRIHAPNRPRSVSLSITLKRYVILHLRPVRCSGYRKVLRQHRLHCSQALVFPLPWILFHLRTYGFLWWSENAWWILPCSPHSWSGQRISDDNGCLYLLSHGISQADSLWALSSLLHGWRSHRSWFWTHNLSRHRYHRYLISWNQHRVLRQWHLLLHIPGCCPSDPEYCRKMLFPSRA